PFYFWKSVRRSYRSPAVRGLRGKLLAQADLAAVGIDVEQCLSPQHCEPLLWIAREPCELADLVPATIAQPLDDRVVDLRAHRHREAHHLSTLYYRTDVRVSLSEATLSSGVLRGSHCPACCES